MELLFSFSLKFFCSASCLLQLLLPLLYSSDVRQLLLIVFDNYPGEKAAVREL